MPNHGVDVSSSNGVGARCMHTYICREVFPASRKPLRALYSDVAKEISMGWLTTSICIIDKLLNTFKDKYFPLFSLAIKCNFM